MSSIISVNDLYNLARDQSVEIPILRDVITLLIASPGITIKQLSVKIGLDRNALSSSIKLLTGMCLATFLKQWRLLLIKELLSDPHLSYESVANLCGFSSVQAMSKFLDRMIHLTAYEYREGRKNGHRK